MCQSLKSGDHEQILHRLRRFSESVDQFFKHLLRLIVRLDSRNALVDIELL